MAEENIILPDEPMLIVERGWNTSGRGSTSSNTTQTMRVDIIRRSTSSPGEEFFSNDAIELTRNTSRSGRRDFQFVAATEPDGRHDSAAQKLVRSHVRKQSSRRDAGLLDTNNRGSFADEFDTDTALPQERRASTGTNHGPIKRSRQRRRSRQESTPPRQESFLSLCSVIRDMFHPLGRFVRFDPDPMEADWYRITMTEDQLLLEATQIVASLNMTVSTDFEAMNCINLLVKSVHEQLIARISEENITDATIGAVMCLAIAGYYLGDEANCETHRLGARNMIIHRGGIYQLDTSLQLRLYSSDIIHAIDQQSKPLFRRLPEFPTMLDPSRHSQMDPAMNLIRNSSMKLDLHLQARFGDMILLTQQIEQAIGSGNALDPQDVDRACIYIQHGLCETQAYSSSEEILRCAAANYIRTLVRGKPFILQGSRKISAHLRACYDQSSQETQDWKLILWTLVFNTMAAAETEHGSYFLERLKKRTQELGYRSWTDLKHILSPFLWVERLHDPLGQSLWQSLEVLAD